ncbi:MAG TPA: c-type cytochrome [Candidatus Sulfotelmatobacter sp.]|jgi:mono/diheme cytochrome c family protein
MKYLAALVICMMLPCALLAAPATDHSWADHVPEKDRARANPFGNSADAIGAGSKLFADHCAKCHGSDALGRRKKPSLRTREVQQAPDGEIFWLLTNGYLKRGMPSWSKLPEPSRWQVVTYVKSLGVQE